MDEQKAEQPELIRQDEIRDAKCDKWDYGTAAFCGGIAGLIDVIFVGAPSQKKEGASVLQQFGDQTADTFVQRAAQFFWRHDKREKGRSRAMPDTLEKCISYLEQAFPIPYDARYAKDLDVADGVLAGMTPTNHHLKSLAHSPDPIGLVFSVIDQFSHSGSFMENGHVIHAVPNKTSGAFPYMEGKTLPGKLFCGFLNWLGHLISDAVGSSSTRAEKKRLAGTDGRGMGIPLPFYSLFQKCTFSVKDHGSIAEVMTNVFEQGYDARFGLVMSIPVLFQALAVRVFWTLRRKIEKGLPWKACIPTDKHQDLRVMMLVSNGVFCAVDGVDALVRGISSGDAVSGIVRLNYVGWMRLAVLGAKEVRIRLGLALTSEEDPFMEKILGRIPEEEKQKILSVVEFLKKNFSLLGLVKEMQTALKEKQLAHDERVRIEAACEQAIGQLRAEREALERAMEGYLAEHLRAFREGFELMDAGLQTDDADLVIRGNVVIQEQLDYDVQFRNQSEFDTLMDSDEEFRF